MSSPWSHVAVTLIIIEYNIIFYNNIVTLTLGQINKGCIFKQNSTNQQTPVIIAMQYLYAIKSLSVLVMSLTASYIIHNIDTHTYIYTHTWSGHVIIPLHILGACLWLRRIGPVWIQYKFHTNMHKLCALKLKSNMKCMFVYPEMTAWIWILLQIYTYQLTSHLWWKDCLPVGAQTLHVADTLFQLFLVQVQHSEPLICLLQLMYRNK